MSVKVILSSSVRILDSGLLGHQKASTSYWYMIEVPVNWRILSIFHESHYDRLRQVYLPITFGNETVYAILSTWVRIWHRAHWLVAKPWHELAQDRNPCAPECPGHISLLPIHHSMCANPSDNTSAKCKSVQKPDANFPDTLVAHTSASKYFQMLPSPTGISNKPSVRQEHLGVPAGPDGIDGTSYPLNENRTRSVALHTHRAAANISCLLFLRCIALNITPWLLRQCGGIATPVTQFLDCASGMSWRICTIRTTHVLHSSQGLQLRCSRLPNA